MCERRIYEGSVWAVIGLLACVTAGGSGVSDGGLVVDFEDVRLSGPGIQAYDGPGGGVYYNGSDGAGGFESHGVFFGTDYNADWMSWSGWAYSTTTDTGTAGFGNQYSSYAGSAASGAVYAVTYAPSAIPLPAGHRDPVSVAVSNVTYAALSMAEGDAFARKFGDDPATPDVEESDYPDSFKLTVTGYGGTGSVLGTVEVYLADYRGPEGEDMILDSWQTVDLSGLPEGVVELGFGLESTDVGEFGMNTPAYLAVDDLVLGETPRWGPYDLGAGPWVNTGAWLGWVYVEGDWVHLLELDRWGYLPGDRIDPENGSWIFLPR